MSEAAAQQVNVTQTRLEPGAVHGVRVTASEKMAQDRCPIYLPTTVGDIELQTGVDILSRLQPWNSSIGIGGVRVLSASPTPGSCGRLGTVNAWCETLGSGGRRVLSGTGALETPFAGLKAALFGGVAGEDVVCFD